MSKKSCGECLWSFGIKVPVFADCHAPENEEGGSHSPNCCCLHNLLQIRYPVAHNYMLDQEDPETYNLIKDPKIHELHKGHIASLFGTETHRASQFSQTHKQSYHKHNTYTDAQLHR